LQGASISLSRGTEILNQTVTNSEGDFEIDVPAKGEFILTITYAGCNTKKFSVSTNGVPESVGKDNYKPTISIGGFVMSRPIKGVDYLGLNEPLVKVEYKSGGQNFDKDEEVTNKGLEIVSKIYDAETKIIEKFCSTNKQGDDALKAKNCPLAKEYYQKAMGILSDEQYPFEQLVKAEQCIKEKQAKDDAVALDKLKKEEAAKQVAEKAKAEKAAKDKEAFAKNAEKTKTSTDKPKEKVPVKESPTIQPKNTDEKSTASETNDNRGNSKYRVPKVIGANKYKETITRADDYFKTKRYTEAKTAYEEALKYKANDPYATSKLEQVNKLLSSK
jgi:tetratricopeptide (TPR) repeat protein